MKHVVGLGLVLCLVSACGEDIEKVRGEIDQIRDDIQEPLEPGAAPASPTALVATSGDAEVLLTWDAAAGATSYQIFRGEIAGGAYQDLSTTTTNAYTDTAVTNGATYYYVVKAMNDAGASGNSNEISAAPHATGNVLLPPEAPTNLVATAVSASQIGLSWSDQSVSETGFKVERKIGPGGSYSVIAVLAAGAKTYTNSGLSPKTQYFYRVFASNAAGNSAASNEAHATTSAGAVAAPSFATKVHPILMANCSGCHSGVSPTRLKLVGSAATDYGTVTALTNAANPSSSLLLEKPSGSVAHGGGNGMPVGSAAYNTILAWIQGGLAR